MKYKEINNYLFEKNRQKLSRRLPIYSLAIINSNDEMPRSGDQFFPFRQNSDLFYLTGIEQPKSILCLCPEHPDVHYREVLFLEKSNPHYETWTGHKLTIEEASNISGIKNIYWLDEFETVLNDLMNYAKHVYLSYHDKSRTFDEVPLRDARFTEKLKNLYPLHAYEQLNPIMADLRLVKEPEELELIKKAINITHSAFQNILKSVKPGIKEYEIEAGIIHDFLKSGSSGHAFQPIVASGKNACVLHYVDNNSVCTDGDLVLIDFGAEYANYNADCTRTIPINGKFSPRQKEIYNAVLKLLNLGVKMVKPGLTIEKLHQDISEIAEQEMIKLGLFTVEEKQNQDPEKPLRRKYFMHGISHYLGIDVHDVGNRSDILMPGMIITWEPGMYIAEEGIGIRLENDLLVTEKGAVNLMAQYPVEPDEIEKLMSK
jgi:Xaa-Pro aminopeptidase